MKFLLSLTIALILGVSVFAQNNNGAKFKFAQETHDFGTLKEGEEATFEFAFTNTGNEPLIINNCSASCGCTVPTWPRSPIMPGSKGTIFVSFNTKDKNGQFTKTIYIESNAPTGDPFKQKFEIYITGSVSK